MQHCLVADDHAMMRAALAGMVALGWPDARLTTAEDFTSAAAAAPGCDLMLCDLAMPDLAPIDGIRMVCAAAPETPAVPYPGADALDPPPPLRTLAFLFLTHPKLQHSYFL